MKKVRLGDVATYINGYAFKPADWSDTGVPIIRIQDLTGNTYQLNRYNGTFDSKYEVLCGDILISWSASLGIYVWNGEKAVLNQHIFKVVFDKGEINKSFFVHQVKNILEKAMSEAHGATMKHLTKPVFDALPFYMPKMEVQNEIANTLDKLIALIDKRKKQLEKLDELVKSRFVEMFGDVNNNKFAYPVVRLGDYARLQGGYAFKSNDFVEEGIPLVQIGNVNKDYLNWDVINSVPYTYLKRFGDFSLKEGDLVMAMTRPIIKTLDSVKLAKVGKSDLPCLLNQRVGRFILSDRLNEIFLEFLCKTDNFKDYVEKMSGNSLQPNISSKQVEDYIIILPPKKLQESFSAFVAQIDKSKSAVQNGLEKLELLKKALMQKYFG